MINSSIQISVVIPNLNGKNIIEKCLKFAIVSLEAIDLKWEIILVDDNSEDDSISLVMQKFPKVRILKNKKTCGFSISCNRGIYNAKGDLVILLNNDVEISKTSLNPALKHFNSKDVFAVNPRIIIPNRNNLNESLKRLRIHHGFIYTETINKKNILYIPYATACAMILDRKKFIALGGFDELFSPFYWEDVDLSYRAWKRGWRVIYEPRSIVYHEHMATISKLNRNYKELIVERNNLIFTWKNISEPKLLIKHFLWLPLVAIKKLITKKFYFFGGLFLAFLKIPAIIKIKIKQSGKSVKKDSEILNIG